MQLCYHASVRLGWGVLNTARAAALAVFALAAACTDTDSLAVQDWTLVASSQSHAIRTPVHVDDLLERRGGTYELRASVALPRQMRGKPLTLAIARLPARACLRVAGERIEPSESTLFVGYRSPGPHRWRINGDMTDVDQLELSLSVDDTWFQSTWIGTTPRLSRHPEGDRWFRFVSRFNLATNAAATALVLMIGCIYLVVFLGNRRHVEYGWLAAQALTASAYPLFMLGTTQWLFGTHDLHFVPLVAIAALASVAYTRSHVGLPAPSRWWLAGGVLVVLAATFAGGPYTSRWGMVVTVATVIVVGAYQLVLCSRLLLRGSHHGDVLTVLVSWIVLSVMAGLDLMHWIGFGAWQHGVQGAGLGLAAFAMLQTLALSREHQRAMTRSHTLNEELRRQVSSRSRQLSHALARMGRSVSGHGELSAGATVDDRYRVLRRLGEGAMATVYQVERIEDRRQFALKQLRGSSDARLLARFAREAHIAAEISHPNLVGIHDIDFASGGFMYIVMDLVRGGAVSDARDRYGDVPWALEVLRQTALGLAAMHAKGVVHRDLKPANILLDEGEAIVARISDFGVSGMLEESASGALRQPPAGVASCDTTSTLQSELTVETVSVGVAALEARHSFESPLLTQAGHLLGTPAYMAPELLDQDSAMPARDVYSFGIVAFELLTGGRPYATPTLQCRLSGIAAPVAKRLAEECPTLDPELARLLQAAVCLEPSERPSLGELEDALRKSSSARNAAVRTQQGLRGMHH